LAALETRVLLIRHGVTDWHAQGRVLGQRDVPLSAAGVEQMQRTAAALADVKIAEIISSPLQRALQSAEIVGRKDAIEVARDPRLTDFQLGRWTGMPVAEITQTPEYQRFLAGPSSDRIPGGESLEEVRRRAVGAIEQAITDNPMGDAIAVISHAGVIRILLTHYLGSPIETYHRIRVSPGSVSVLAFGDDREVPRLYGVNLPSDVARVMPAPPARPASEPNP
jgi:broad specificity phosphatase PhoE